MNTVQSAIEVVDQFQHTGIQVRHGDGWVRMKVQHAHHFEKKEKERAQRKTTAGGATLHVFADTPESVALLNPERVKTGLGKIGLVVTEGPHQPDDNTSEGTIQNHRQNRLICKVIPKEYHNAPNAPPREEVINDFPWPNHIPMELGGGSEYEARFSIQGKYSSPPIEITKIYTCCHAPKGGPHLCEKSKAPLRAGKRKATVTMVRPETARSECTLYHRGLCFKQDQCTKIHHPYAGGKIPCALAQASPDTLTALGMNTNVVICRRGKSCEYDHTSWTPETNKTAQKGGKDPPFSAKEQKTDRQKKKQHQHGTA